MKTVHVCLSITALMTCSFLASNPVQGQPDRTARKLAESVYADLRSDLLDRSRLDSAAATLSQAMTLDEDEPWVYIAASQLALSVGYNIGSWYEIDSFDKEALAPAKKFAERAVTLGQQEAESFSNLASFYIRKKNFVRAEQLLSISRDLDIRNFNVPFYTGVLHLIQSEPKLATENFTLAKSLATEAYQQRLLLQYRRRVAAMQGDVQTEEKLFLQGIRDFPDYPYTYGQYAAFLVKLGRLDEGIDYWQRTVAIRPYRNARENLQWATRRKASENRRIEEFDALLFAGADIDEANQEGKTRLILAARYGRSKESLYLIEKGADVNHREDSGHTAVMRAAGYGNVIIAAQLIYSGADINEQANEGYNALGLAARYGYVAIVRLLLESGANVNIQNDWGWTPLNKAARGGHLNVVKLLLDFGADHQLKRTNGRSAVDTAETEGQLHVADYLRSIGAK